MTSFFWLVRYSVVQGMGIVLMGTVLVTIVSNALCKTHPPRARLLGALFILGIVLFITPIAWTKLFQYPLFLHTYGPAEGPAIGVKDLFRFFLHSDKQAQISDIARDPRDVPPPIARDTAQTVRVRLEAQEVLAEMAPGVMFNYWTFNGTVPGPFIRARVGDMIALTLKNNLTSLHHHNIDLHAVTGPGGGAVLTNVAPGEEKTLMFKALHPGLFVYHCAHTNPGTHMAHGMYGMILIEPEGGLPAVDREFYVMQGEFYSSGMLGQKGLQLFDAGKMLDGDAEYVVFNGRTGGLAERMEAKTGERIRLFFGNGGVNYISSFHIIGEIFDTVYPEAALGSAPHTSIQTTLVPAGGATVAEFTVEVPGNYMLVDHALARADRGAWGMVKVTGDARPDIFDGDTEPTSGGGH